jgi:two-component system phosphate regulon sensor histidine kinase PhoR
LLSCWESLFILLSLPESEADAVVAILDFLLGLAVGGALLGWQRARSNARLKKILRNLQIGTDDSPFSVTSQLSLAIAQQRKEQQQLQQQFDTLQQVLSSAPIGYLQVDDENRLLWCNGQARAILGIGSEVIWSKPRLLLELVRSYELDDLIEQTREAGYLCQSSWTFHPTSSDPSDLLRQPVLTLQGYGLPLPDNSIGVFLENRQELVALMQQRDRWTSDLAHELKTPLTSIRLVAETLQARLDPSLKTWVDRLINETIRLSNLVQDLLDLNQMQRDSLSTSQLKPTDLVNLIHSVWSSLEPLARRKQLRLDYAGPNHLLMQLDEPRIHRLLINLLDNSIKYSPPDHPIRVAVSLEKQLDDQADTFGANRICLEVIDHGPGFPEKALPYVFERFYRADPSRARIDPTAELEVNQRGFVLTSAATPQQAQNGHAQGGSGLGLAIVRQIVEAHHGTVSASNHPETGGAWLQVRLPRQGAELPEPT